MENNEKLFGKHRLELNIVGDGREFLNFWDWAHGNDVYVEIRDKSLILNADEPEEKVISFEEFLILVKASIASRTI